MSKVQDEWQAEIYGNSGARREKLPWVKPALTIYGSVRILTQATAGSGTDGGVMAGMTMPMIMSDLRCKQNLTRIGTHPLGFGLYLFDFRTEFRGPERYGRHFGVLAQEVEEVMPSAVSIGLLGYRQVDYNAIGITVVSH